MNEREKIPASIDEYIALYPSDVQLKLQELRQVIHDAAPEATEKISWQMPTFYLHGNLIHFAAYKKHIGLYPGDEGIEAFAGEFADFKRSKGAVQFPLDKPLPADLIRRIVVFRVAANLKEAEAKAAKKKKPGR